MLSHVSALVMPSRSWSFFSASSPGSALWRDARRVLPRFQDGSLPRPWSFSVQLCTAHVPGRGEWANTFCSPCVLSLKSMLKRYIPVNQSLLLIQIKSSGITEAEKIGKVVNYLMITIIPLSFKYLFPSLKGVLYLKEFHLRGILVIILGIL